MTDFNSRLKETLNNLEDALVREMGESCHWSGELSSSALATAAGVFALAKYDPQKYGSLIDNGLLWLKNNINNDGGWGDSVKNKSNLSTSLLCWSALSLTDGNSEFDEIQNSVRSYICRKLGISEPEPAPLAKAVLKHYGRDMTFSVPILTMCALAGRLGQGGDEWKLIPQLPFELAVFPHSFFKVLNLPVVSYAVPALIAIGLVKHKKRPAFAPVKNLRDIVTGKVLKVLEDKQPCNGGFIEAIPLTSFVSMCIIESEHKDHTVVQRGISFIESSVREDGSWPIDSNLSTWVSSLAVNALASTDKLSDERKDGLKVWLMDQQTKEVHPFTNAGPGGWGWTDLPGAVPDADDTSCVLRALKKLSNSEKDYPLDEVSAGIRWLLNLQNSDGGIPTFCKGWGKLPFDRSCPEITAHAMMAFAEWREHLEYYLRIRVDKALPAMLDYLSRSQERNGSWLPLWFGNEHAERHENPVYGTSKVLTALKHESIVPAAEEMTSKAVEYLLSVQNPDGGWGGAKGVPSSVEESAVALKALAGFPEAGEAVIKGAEFLMASTDNGKKIPEASPIGLYFASLWYHERLYPLIFTIDALSQLPEGDST